MSAAGLAPSPLLSPLPSGARPAAEAGPPLLAVEGLTKRYGGLVAAKSIGFTVRAGEIVGLIGPNGSGKSTVMKLIMGLERPNAGSVRLDGTEIAGWPSHRVARAGIGLVFQHSRPLHRQTVLENIKLALLPDSLIRLFADAGVEARARAIAERVGLGAVMDRRPGTLPFADLRRMELAKAIARDPKVVLVDEPFAGLTSAEVADFSALIRGFRDEGKAVLLVDHNVKSVSALVDRVFAMYLGERVAEGTAAEVMRNETVRRVYLGGSIETASRPEAKFSGEPLLKVEGLDVLYGKAQALRQVGIHVHEGEFVSVVGLNGAGKTTLFNAISGLVPHAGRISFAGEPLAKRTPASIAKGDIRGGIVQVPESRELFGEMSVRENLDLGGQHLPKAESARQLEWLFELFPILKSRGGQMARTLSGGEQQMLTIARALMMKPRLLILDEPTLGLAPVILEQLSKALERLRQTTPITVLLGEQNVTFALPHADRVYVLEHARIVWEGTPDRFAAEAGTGYL
ncbi:ATP-binding cassette domain-containing protein [Methylobacterium sp. 17Sr1-1]|uniref:ATP-binding cassette domain-containing protein n=1 Tax=Methylobacterium sp. 17Sr1-1 TaxID=2202826 RepID=UPI000D6F8C4C|nr:ATP-binding cassette domain-containing protein [Methylobacterium sp. 17Sr1-1]AWN51270.1 ABC transporter ATP-binding protein [Methylobacterium sp. 17Sr1-1]